MTYHEIRDGLRAAIDAARELPSSPELEAEIAGAEAVLADGDESEMRLRLETLTELVKS